MRTIVIIAACAFALSAARAEARMYQWSNPTSGTVQLSGSPPAWYRSATQGPRVLVFDNGQLVDDTAVAVTDELRRALRADAFGDEGEVVAARAPEPAPESQTRLREVLGDAAEEGVDVRAVTDAFAAEREAAGDGKGTVEQTVAELKSLLDAWDSRRFNEAKELLRNADEASAAPR